jgi:hypothetical protein
VNRKLKRKNKENKKRKRKEKRKGRSRKRKRERKKDKKESSKSKNVSKNNDRKTPTSQNISFTLYSALPYKLNHPSHNQIYKLLISNLHYILLSPNLFALASQIILPSLFMCKPFNFSNIKIIKPFQSDLISSIRMFISLESKKRKHGKSKILAGRLCIQKNFKFPNAIFMIPSPKKTLGLLIPPIALNTTLSEKDTGKMMKMRSQKMKRNSSRLKAIEYIMSTMCCSFLKSSR